MSETTAKTTQRLYPATRYRDARAAIAWLCRAFGFTEHAVYAGDGDTIAHAELSYEGGLFMFGSARDDGYPVRPVSEVGTPTASIYVAVDDTDAHYARAKAAGAEIVREPMDMEYGSREYSARDLEGNLWSFGTYRP
jgi:uncharacterized glyoxalase superfamily protein PhnB